MSVGCDRPPRPSCCYSHFPFVIAHYQCFSGRDTIPNNSCTTERRRRLVARPWTEEETRNLWVWSPEAWHWMNVRRKSKRSHVKARVQAWNTRRTKHAGMSQQSVEFAWLIYKSTACLVKPDKRKEPRGIQLQPWLYISSAPETPLTSGSTTGKNVRDCKGGVEQKLINKNTAGDQTFATLVFIVGDCSQRLNCLYMRSRRHQPREYFGQKWWWEKSSLVAFNSKRLNRPRAPSDTLWII